MDCDECGRFGKVEDAVVMYDKKTGRSRGFGFITYDNPEVVRKVSVSILAQNAPTCNRDFWVEKTFPSAWARYLAKPVRRSDECILKHRMKPSPSSFLIEITRMLHTWFVL